MGEVNLKSGCLTVSVRERCGDDVLAGLTRIVTGHDHVNVCRTRRGVRDGLIPTIGVVVGVDDYAV